MFSVCVDALAPKGRLLIIGMMSSYASGWAPSSYPGLTGGCGCVFDKWYEKDCVGASICGCVKLKRVAQLLWVKVRGT